MRDESVRNIVSEILETVRPEELLILDASDPKTVEIKSTASGPLGIGVSLTVAVVAPIIWKIVESLAGEILKEGAKRTAKVVIDYISKKFQTTDMKEVEARITEFASKELDACNIAPDEKVAIARRIAEVLSSRLQKASV